MAAPAPGLDTSSAEARTAEAPSVPYACFVWVLVGFSPNPIAMSSMPKRAYSVGPWPVQAPAEVLNWVHFVNFPGKKIVFGYALSELGPVGLSALLVRRQESQPGKKHACLWLRLLHVGDGMEPRHPPMGWQLQLCELMGGHCQLPGPGLVI
ncbi:unnamed protein product [Symbiodinium natans]|uniref:Uncharacterized protein n=1 Tax=Symbiodinium natans TaxID=878477 RepID=A0A812TSV5_9DINO|nr:unnamed protein product [Symbiodinium natans]